MPDLVPFLSVSNEDLERLSPGGAVDVFTALLHAEARSSDIGSSLISVPSAITVGDGGIDAEVADAPSTGSLGIIKKGLTRYQIKSGPMHPQRPGKIKDILLTEKRDAIKPKIKSCLDSGGTLIVILFGDDNPDPNEDFVAGFQEELAQFDSKYLTAAIEIWQQNQLRGFFEKFPSLALRLKGGSANGFYTHEMWSTFQEMRLELRLGETQQKLIDEEIRGSMRSASSPTLFHVYGEPGIGKTRLVKEAMEARDLEPLILYFVGPRAYVDSGIESVLNMPDCPYHVILVIDECDVSHRSAIWNRLRNLWPRVKVLTIAPEEAPASGGDVRSIGVLPLDDEQLAEIIESYGIPAYEAKRWPELLGGAPRLAHLMGQNLRDNPDDLTREPSTTGVWEKMTNGPYRADSDQARQRRVVLQFLALFKRFGYEVPVADEGIAIAQLIQQQDGSISMVRFREIVKELREEKVLQGEFTLYIAIRLFHVKLWADWWDTYRSIFDISTYENALTPSLIEAFREMFVYAAESEAADRLVEQLLGEHGPFKGDAYLRTEAGSRFFLALTEGNPSYALICLQRNFANWTDDDYRSFTTGRRQVVWALERIVVWSELFSDAATILLKLGEFENESVSNNATGVFVGLFDTQPGPVAATEAPPINRLPILIRALDSASANQKMIALNACRNALRIRGSGFRMVGPGHQGLRRTPQMWIPSGRDEIIEYLERIWGIVTEQIDSEFPEIQAVSLDVLIDASRDFSTIPEFGGLVMETLESIATHHKIRVLERTIEILNFDGDVLPADIKDRLEQLKDRLTGDDFSSLLRRYVGTDIFEDRFNSAGERINDKDKHLEELATQALHEPGLLNAELTWLVTAQAKDGLPFGMNLAIQDIEMRLLQPILDAQKSAGADSNLLFLGGYLRGIGNRDQEALEKIVASMYTKPDTKNWVAELTWRSNLGSDESASRVIQLAREGVVGMGQLRTFVFGAAVQKFSVPAITEWMEFLLESDDSDGLGTAADLADMYLFEADTPTLPDDLVLRLILRDEWYVESSRSRSGTGDFHWERLANRVSKNSPTIQLQISSKILELLGTEGSYSGLSHSRIGTFLGQTISSNPKEMWRMISEYIEPPLDIRGWEITTWLRGALFNRDESAVPLDLLPLNDVLGWIDDGDDLRALLAATFVPPRIDDVKNENSLVRQLLIRFGNREDIRRALEGSFSSGGWWGEASAHFSQKKSRLEGLLKEEQIPIVRDWLNSYISRLKAQIESEVVREERNF